MRSEFFGLITKKLTLIFEQTNAATRSSKKRKQVRSDAYLNWISKPVALTIRCFARVSSDKTTGRVVGEPKHNSKTPGYVSCDCGRNEKEDPIKTEREEEDKQLEEYIGAIIGTLRENEIRSIRSSLCEQCSCP